MENAKLQSFLERVIYELYLATIREHNEKHSGLVGDIESCTHTTCKRVTKLRRDLKEAEPL